MIIFRTIVFITLILNCNLLPQQINDAEPYPSTAFNFSLFHGISTAELTFGDKPFTVKGLNFVLLTSEVDVLKGISVGGLYTEVNETMSYVSISSLVNIVGIYAEGIMISSIANIIGGSFSGVIIDGLININGKDFEGAAVGGLFNLAGRSAVGFQSGGFANITGTNFDGFQSAGVFNITGRDFDGFQAGGVFNITGRDFSGLQAGGVINKTGGSFSGAQISGVVNVANEFESGVQIGVVNISEKHDGLPIGLVSYNDRTGLGLQVWGNSASLINAGLRSGNDKWYNLLVTGVKAGEPFTWLWGAGIGRYFEAENYVFDIGFMHYHLNYDEFFTDELYNLTELRIAGHNSDWLGIKTIFGISFNWLVRSNEVPGSLDTWNLVEESSPEGGYIHTVWPALIFGFEF